MSIASPAQIIFNTTASYITFKTPVPLKETVANIGGLVSGWVGDTLLLVMLLNADKYIISFRNT